ncbi:polyprenyl synthetase family protein [Geomonas sp. RF6]|uniref:polyprenyl synthetase family protein n=1 Tax=Geomonas sp. RF6 TaxID=2897342 RepID=UPI001E60FFD5|nr:polyprenyl synthetase family protein [Geomonas sp. RF6]UFS69900.1 polyprenyl synthetase family protein [Geomonas sp. RF6]
MREGFLQYAEGVKPRLDAAFDLTLDRLLDASAPFGFTGEMAPLKSGKKMRGLLLCLVAETLGGELPAALPRAVAVELIHTASLIHDDFVDQHRFRRDHAALWSLDGARRAVLLGDVIFASAIRMMSELGREDGRIVSEAIAEVALGAYQEPLGVDALLGELKKGRVTKGVYRKLIHLKTAILFGAACELGAVAAKGGEEAARRWRQYGVKIGAAYQIADDLQEVELALQRGSVRADDLTALSPALLFFGGALLPHIVLGLSGGELEVSGEVRELFEDVASGMKKERERSLQDAVAEIAADLRDDHLGKVALRTPWELIDLFDAASRGACVP